METDEDAGKTPLENKSIRLAIRLFLIFIMTALSVVFFGLLVPFFLLAMNILPGLGVGGVIYFFLGGLFGLVFGGIFSIGSLWKSPRLVPRSYLFALISLIIFSCLYFLAYFSMYERFSHV